MSEPVVNPPAPPEPAPALPVVDPPTPAGDGGAPPDPKTLLGGAEPPKAPELDADGKPKGEVQTDPKDAKPQGAPEKYDFILDGVTLDPAMLEKFEPLARELNLSNEDANKLLPLASELLQNQQKAQAEAWSKQINDWGETVKADKVLGGENLPGTLKAAGTFMKWIGMPELTALMDIATPENPGGLGLGNHPVLVAAFAKAGKAMAEDGFIQASRESSGKKDLAHQMYPEMP